MTTANATDLAKLRRLLVLAETEKRRAKNDAARKMALYRCDILLDRWLRATRDK